MVPPPKARGKTLTKEEFSMNIGILFHSCTGNTLSVVANRISYVFDWRGPSFTVDTA